MAVVKNVKGKLFVVATPIGNLGDITYRAVERLKNVAFILAEDTRYTGKLLKHYEIKTQTVSYRDQNHDKMMDKILEKLDMGLDLALVSDAGTPLISDPGYRLVSELRDKGYNVMTVPGASALTASASIAGLPTDRLLFLGFLPKSEGKRSEALKLAYTTEATLVLYESPNRIEKLLNSIKVMLGGERKIAVCRELTKLHESVYVGNVDKVWGEMKADEGGLRGEFVVLVGKE